MSKTVESLRRNRQNRVESPLPISFSYQISVCVSFAPNVARTGDTGNAHWILVGKREGRRLF
jgi:hypothetical protein